MAVKACAFLSFFLVAASFPSYTLAETDPKLDAVIEQLSVEVDIQSTGDAMLNQYVEYRFLRDSTYVDFSFDTSGARGYSLLAIAVADIPENSSQESFKLHLLRAGEEPAAMTYEIKQSGGVMDMRVYMPVKAGTRRSVRFQFSMLNTIRLYKDVADFNMVLLSPGTAVNRFTATIRASKPLNDGRVFATGSDGLQSAVNPESGAVQIQDGFLAAGENIRIRCLLPTAAFADSLNRFNDNALKDFLVSEAVLQDNDSHMRDLRNALPTVLLVLLGLAPLFLLVQYLLFDRERPLIRRHNRIMPEMGALPPPIAGLLLHRRVSGRELAAALYDLAARGCLRIEGHTFIRIWDDRLLDDLTDYDRFLMQWMITRIGEDGRVTAPMVTQAARGAGPADFYHAYGVFKQLLRAHSRRLGLVDRAIVLRGKILAIVLGAVYTLLAIVLTLVERSFEPLALLVPAALFSLHMIRVRRLTPLGSEQLAIARAFRSNLRRAVDFDDMSAPMTMDMWSRYLPFAIALGVEDDFLDRTAKIYTFEEMRNQRLFSEYGMCYMPGDDKEAVFRNFHLQLKGNTAAFLTAALYAAGGDRFTGKGEKANA